MNILMPFHLAIPVSDIAKAREFYGVVLGCSEGRSGVQWVDFNFFGHQLVVHFDLSAENQEPPLRHNPVDGHEVPVPHFGVVLDWENWHQLAENLKQHNMPFVIEPYIRFQGRVGEQATIFFLDPFGNALEFKAFRYPEDLFRKQ
ncbi:VOC family protein [Kaarinaea lacus]